MIAAAPVAASHCSIVLQTGGLSGLLCASECMYVFKECGVRACAHERKKVVVGLCCCESSTTTSGDSQSEVALICQGACLLAHGHPSRAMPGHVQHMPPHIVLPCVDV